MAAGLARLAKWRRAAQQKWCKLRTCLPRTIEPAPQPLTALTEEEKLFQTTVRQFAREQIGPYVREMDEAGVFRKDIIRQFFEMGLMGIEIPEEYGGRAAASSSPFWRWKNYPRWILRPA